MKRYTPEELVLLEKFKAHDGKLTFSHATKNGHIYTDYNTAKLLSQLIRKGVIKKERWEVLYDVALYFMS